MEELNKGYEFTKAQIAELESLRAWKAEIEKQEPVGYKMTQEEWFRTDGRTPNLWFGHLPYGRKIYADPVVSPDVAALKAERDYHLANAKQVYSECSALKAENQSLQAELEAARKDAESWRSYKKRKDEVIAAGMGRNVLREAAIEQAKGA